MGGLAWRRTPFGLFAALSLKADHLMGAIAERTALRMPTATECHHTRSRLNPVPFLVCYDEVPPYQVGTILIGRNPRRLPFHPHPLPAVDPANLGRVPTITIRTSGPRSSDP